MILIETGILMTYGTAETIRQASEAETIASLDAAERDGGAGVIEVEGRPCYVEGGRRMVAAWAHEPGAVRIGDDWYRPLTVSDLGTDHK